MIGEKDERLQVASKPVNPEMITLAREARGLSQEALADALEVSQGRVSKMETGFSPVPDDLLQKLSDVLHYPVPFFMQDDRVMGAEIAEIFHRKRQDVPTKLLNKIYARMEIHRRHVAALCQATELPKNVRRLDIDEYNGHAALIARLVRAAFRLPRGPIRNLTKTLEDAGIVIVPMDFETNRIDAIARYVPGMPPIIFLNEKTSTDRCRFSLAHELGHLVMHEYPSPDIEKQADAFAAEFLMPEQDIQPDLLNLTLNKLAQLKRHWKVSMAALLYRAQTLGTITANAARLLWAEMARRGYKTKEPVELDMTGERPSLLRELFTVHRDTLGYNEDELAHLLLLKSDELRSMYLDQWWRPKLHAMRSFR